MIHATCMCVCVCVCVSSSQDLRDDVETSEKLGHVLSVGLIGEPPHSHHVSLLHQRRAADRQRESNQVQCNKGGTLSGENTTQSHRVKVWDNKLNSL